MKKTLLINFMCIMSVFFAKAQTSTTYGQDAGNTGNDNSSFGYQAGDLVTGGFNSFYGSLSGKFNTSGSNNTFYGYASGYNTTTGGTNTIVGRSAGFYNTTGSSNVFLGWGTGLTNSSGSTNTYLGSRSGYNNAVGTGNIFIGYESGFNEYGSNKLYIDNSNTSTPLIYGDFSSNQVGINALPGGYTLNVGGIINATGVYVNGQPVGSGGGGTSQWATSGSNITYNVVGGNVAIGTALTSNPNSYKLAVNGKIGAKEVQVENTSSTWADYVFKSDYNLMPLTEVESFIKSNQHLPEIPSAEEVKENGHKLGEMDVLLLKKVEELTLYIIDLKKEVDAVKKENAELKKHIK
jgi:hypothetical protein